MQEATTEQPKQKLEPKNLPRAIAGGILMGLANLVPGISGGTMLVATGIYKKFIDAVAEVSALKFRAKSIALLLTVAISAACAIVLLAGPVKSLVVNHRWVMNSIFIGLTLGGVPIVWRMIAKKNASVFIAIAVGLVAMVSIALMQDNFSAASSGNNNWALLFSAGAIAAGAMILPGISGAYLLQVIGVYITILSAVDQAKIALKSSNYSALATPAVEVVLPVGIGVVVGIVVISNILKKLLAKFEPQTLGVLVGLLIGAVAGLYPFQQGICPKVGDLFKGQILTADAITKISPDKYPTATFLPAVWQVGVAVLLIAVGFVITMLIAKLGSDKTSANKIGDNNE